MCVRVFLADDAEVMRKAIRRLLSDREDIAVIGEGSNFRETIQKTAELHPDLIILDVHLAERDSIAPPKVKGLLNGAKVLAITLGADEVSSSRRVFRWAIRWLTRSASRPEILNRCTKRCAMSWAFCAFLILLSHILELADDNATSQHFMPRLSS